MIYGLQSNLIYEEYTGDLESLLLIENFELSGKLLSYDILNEGQLLSSISALVKITLEKFLLWLRKLIRKVVLFVKTRNKDKIVYYGSFDKITDQYNLSNVLSNIDKIVCSLIYDQKDPDQQFESFVGITKEEYNVDLFFDKSSEEKIKGKDAYKKYIELLNTIDKDLTTIKMSSIVAKIPNNKLTKRLNDFIGDDEVANKFINALFKTMTENLTYMANVQMKAINMALADAGTSKSNTKEKSDNE